MHEQSVVTIEDSEPLMEALRLMKKEGIRHLPVTEDGTIIGVLSVGIYCAPLPEDAGIVVAMFCTRTGGVRTPPVCYAVIKVSDVMTAAHLPDTPASRVLLTWYPSRSVNLALDVGRGADFPRASYYIQTEPRRDSATRRSRASMAPRENHRGLSHAVYLVGKETMLN